MYKATITKITCMGALAATLLSQPQICRSSDIVKASDAGAVLNSNLLNGGGTDDTVALQSVLNRAQKGTPVHLLIDGVALTSGLNIYGNSVIECVRGGGLYLKDGANRAIIRNANRSRKAIADERITVRGCFMNGNRQRQKSADIPRSDVPFDTSAATGFESNKEKDGTFISGLQFLGVNDLHVEKVTLWNVRAFAILVANANGIRLRDITIDHGGGPEAGIKEYSQTDGMHFKGPVRDVVIDGATIRTGDDAIAINANDYDTDDLTVRNDFGPYVGQGPITDVVINNIHLLETNLGIRLLSSKERIDRITISNVTGTVRSGYAFVMSHWFNEHSLGNFGAITIDNINIDRWNRRIPMVAKLEENWRIYSSKGKALEKEFNGGISPFLSINGHIDTLVFRNVVTKVTDDRPIVRFGPDARVRSMVVDLNLDDAEMVGVPVQLDRGSKVEHLNISLNWNGGAPGARRKPINSAGGVIDSINWMNTPPWIVSATMAGASTVDVTFSQEIKAPDLKAGVHISVNGSDVGILTAEGQSQRDTVRYTLAKSIRSGDVVTWAYDSRTGNMQNLSGNQLPSVSQQASASRQSE